MQIRGLAAWINQNSPAEPAEPVSIIRNLEVGNISRKRFEITTITPLHIGDGSVIGKLDSVVDNGRIYFVDQDKFFQYIETNNLVDNYLRFVDNTSAQQLSIFLRNNKCDISDFINGICDGGHEYTGISNPKPINTFIRTAGRTYIPGSSLKGAVRTAIAYDRIKKLDGDVVEGFAVQIEQTLNHITMQKAEKMEKLKTIADDIYRRIGLSNDTENQRDYLSGLHMSDSTFFEDDQTYIKQKYSLNINKGTSKTEGMTCEYLRKSNVVNFDVTIDKMVSLQLDFGDMMQQIKVYYQSMFEEAAGYAEIVKNSTQNRTAILPKLDKSKVYINLGGTSGILPKLLFSAFLKDERYFRAKRKLLSLNTPTNHFHDKAKYSPQCLKIVDGYSPGWCVIEEV